MHVDFSLRVKNLDDDKIVAGLKVPAISNVLFVTSSHFGEDGFVLSP